MDEHQLQTAYTQRGFLCGAYGEHECLIYVQNKLKNDDLTLKSYESSLGLSEQMTK